MRSKNSPPQKLWNRLLSVFMALALVVTSIVGFAQSKETVKAEDLRMVVDGNGNITWNTSSHKSTASVRFRTVGWYFQFSYKDAETGKIVNSPKDPVYVKSFECLTPSISAKDGKAIYDGDFATDTSGAGSILYNLDTASLNKKGSFEYIADNASFNAKLIQNSAGEICGILFIQKKLS